MTARTLAQDFTARVAEHGRAEQRDVTLTWTSEVPMEFRLHVWQPTGDGEGVTVIWSLSRDVLAEATTSEAATGVRGAGEVMASWVRSAGEEQLSLVWLRLPADEGHVVLSLPAPRVAALVRTSLSMCPPESEAVDVDGLIHKIFQNAEEAQ